MSDWPAQKQDDEDPYDYPMSDTFVAETRQRPYATGFRARRHPWRPSIAYINRLSDRDFLFYVRNGCRLPSEEPDLQDELDAVRAELRACKVEMQAIKAELQALLRVLQAKNDALRQSTPRPALIESQTNRRGLDVEARM